MPKQMVEIEVPDGWEIVGFRPPLNGERVLGCGSAIEKQFGDGALPRIILRPVWQWPAWLKAPWIAMGENGSWYAYESEPHDCSDGLWHEVAGAHWEPGDGSPEIAPTLYDFTPPPCTDWRQSKRKNPTL